MAGTGVVTGVIKNFFKNLARNESKNVAKQLFKEATREAAADVGKQVAKGGVKGAGKAVVTSAVKGVEKDVVSSVGKRVARESVGQSGKAVTKDVGKSAVKSVEDIFGKTGGKVVRHEGSGIGKEVGAQMSRRAGETAAGKAVVKDGGTSVVKEATQEASASAVKEVEKEVVESAAKDGSRSGIGENIKNGLGSVADGFGGFAKEHPMFATIAGVAGWSKLTNTPVIDLVGDVALGQGDISKKGVLPGLTEAVGGEGTVDKLGDGFSSVMNKIEEGSAEVRKLFNTPRDNRFMGNQYAIFGSPYDSPLGSLYGFGGYGSPEAYQLGGQAAYGQQSQTGFMGYLKNLVNNFTSDGLSGRNMLGLGSAAWLLFGRFGWPLKALGMLMGSYSLNSVMRTPQMSYRTQQRGEYYDRDVLPVQEVAQEQEQEQRSRFRRL